MVKEKEKTDRELGREEIEARYDANGEAGVVSDGHGNPAPTWSIFVPTFGALAKGAHWGFTTTSSEIAAWKTAKGAHAARARGFENAIGIDRKTLWAAAVVDDTHHIKTLAAALEQQRTKAYNQDQSDIASARMAHMEANWKARGTVVTFGSTRVDYGALAVDEVVDQIDSCVVDLFLDGGAGVFEAKVQQASLPGVLDKLDVENPGRLGAGRAGAFAIFVEANDKGDWLSWWLCWRSETEGLLPDDGGDPLLTGKTITELRSALTARRSR